jgi:hypothetical protein
MCYCNLGWVAGVTDCCGLYCVDEIGLQTALVVVVPVCGVGVSSELYFVELVQAGMLYLYWLCL